MQRKENENDIAVIGIAGRFPEAENVEAFWRNLASGRDSIRLLPEVRKKELEQAIGEPLEGEYVKSGYLDTIARFEPGYFNISEEESKYIDPQHRIGVELVEEAVQSAGYNTETIAREKVEAEKASKESFPWKKYPVSTGHTPCLPSTIEHA